MELIDLKRQYEHLKTDIDAGIKRVLTHGQFIMGAEVAELEGELARFVGAKHCICCANGTDALQLLYMAYGVGEGDAVFCPDVTFIASSEPAVMLGATPVFCDITADTYNLHPVSLEAQINAVLLEGKLRPKAVVVVDFLGNPADYDAILEICSKYNLILIEDAAQSFGATYHGKRCGSFGHSATTSFFPAKPLGCYGDGGAVFTNDDQIAYLCRSIQVHGKGQKGKYANERVGINSRIDTLQAAILLVKLKALESHEIAARNQVAARYNNAFSMHFTTPYVAENCESIFAQYALLADTTEQRDAIIEKLTASNIPNMVYYPTPQHQLPVFSSVAEYGETFAQSTDYCARTFSLPMHPYLTEDEQNSVINAVLQAKKGAS